MIWDQILQQQKLTWRCRYFPEIFREPTKYLEDCSGTRKWLTELRARGVKLFMVTNSDKKYADALMDHCFGTDWKCTLKEN